MLLCSESLNKYMVSRPTSSAPPITEEDLVFDNDGSESCYIIAQGTHHVRAIGAGGVRVTVNMKWACECTTGGDVGNFINPPALDGTYGTSDMNARNHRIDADRKGLKTNIFYIRSTGDCRKTRVDGTPGPSLCTESGEINYTEDLRRVGFINGVKEDWLATFDLKGKYKEAAQAQVLFQSWYSTMPSNTKLGLRDLACQA